MYSIKLGILCDENFDSGTDSVTFFVDVLITN